jgi:hypothetical protein
VTFEPDKTDKIENRLLDEYQIAFRDLFDKPIRLLEIGIFRGGSLQLWDTVFRHPETRIVGIDLRIPPLKCSPRVVASVCDQNDTEGLRRIAKEHGPFHVIIDDGAHMARETRNCFDTLFGEVVPGGFYGIEDWAVGYWPDQLPEYRGMVEFVTELVQRVPSLNIGGVRITVGPGCLALFQKSVVPFAEKVVPPGLRAAEQYYKERVARDHEESAGR